MSSFLGWLKKWGALVLAGFSFVAGLLISLLARRSPDAPQASSSPDPYQDLKTSIEAREKSQEERERIGREEQAALSKNQEALIRLEAARRAALREKEREVERATPEQLERDLSVPLPPLPPYKEGGWTRCVVLSLLILGAILILLAQSCLDNRSVLPEAQAATTSRPVCLPWRQAQALQIERLRLWEAARECRERIGAIREEERIVCRASLQRSALELQVCRGERTRALSRPPCPPQRACSCVWPVVGAATAGILIGGAVGVGIGAVAWGR